MREDRKPSFAAVAVTLGILAFWGQAQAASGVAASQCGVAAGAGISNLTQNCNFGPTPEELRRMVDDAVKGAGDAVAGRYAELGHKLGVSNGAIRTLLQIVGRQPDVPDDQLAEQLAQVAIEYKALQAQVSATNPDNAAARELTGQAKAEIDAGHLEHAHALLQQATQAQLDAAREAHRLGEKARAAENSHALGAARSTALEGDLALTERNYWQAGERFARAAGLLPPGHRELSLSYLERSAQSLWGQGEERGDDKALRIAATIEARLLTERPREQAPREWAKTESNVGNILSLLGERENTPAPLQQAIVAYGDALQVYTKEQTPSDWATAQNNLGNALETLGARETGTAHLEQAVAAYHAALQVRTRDAAPLDWAQTQANLGTALRALGLRETGVARLQEAVATYQGALEVQTRDQRPLEWAIAQNNLGNALMQLGERETGTEHLTAAVAAFNAALDVRTRDKAPFAWATTQNNRAAALFALGERESGTATLQQAAAANRAALGVITQDKTPLIWAQSQTNLGNILVILGMRENGTENLDQSAAAYRAALQIITRDSQPLGWASLEAKLGEATGQAARRRQNAAGLDDAIGSLRGAREVFRASGAIEPETVARKQIASFEAARDQLRQ